MLLTRLLVYSKRILELGNSQMEEMPMAGSLGKGTAALPLLCSSLQQNSLKEFQELSIISLHSLSSHSLLTGCHPPHSTVTALVSLLKDPQVAQFQRPVFVLLWPDMLAAFDGAEGLPSWNALLALGHLSLLVSFCLVDDFCSLFSSSPLNIRKPRAQHSDLFPVSLSQWSHPFAGL